MARILLPQGIEMTTEAGKTLSESLTRLGWPVWQPCGGHGLCGRCRVEARGQLEPLTEREWDHLSPQEISRGVRLACQARIAGDVKVSSLASQEQVHILAQAGPEPRVDPGAEPVLKRLPWPVNPTAEAPSLWEGLQSRLGTEFRAGSSVLRELAAGGPEQEEEAGWLLVGRGEVLGYDDRYSPSPLGLALDLGTTTLVAYLLELESGRRLGAAVLRNPQGVWGADVISRIAHAAETGGLGQLQNLLQNAVNRLIRRLLTDCGCGEQSVMWVVAVANTAMMHLWLGIDPWRLGRHPYIPVWRDALRLQAVEAGLRLDPRARLEVMPALAGFVGSDALAAALAVELGRQGERALLVDLGTNGEMLLAGPGEIWATSTALGPAFEGGGISAGMPAVPGAVQRVQLDRQGWQLEVLGGGEPQGVCGSGLIDILALARQHGLLEESGRVPPEQPRGWAEPMVAPGRKGHDLLLVPDGSLRVTQEDVRRLQLAKAAVAAGIQTLLHRAGFEAGDLDRLLVAGAFGNHLRLDRTLALGLLPGGSRNQVEFVGNAAGQGAEQALLMAGRLEKARHRAGQVRHLELADDAGFARAFTEHMALKPWGE